MRKNGVKLMTTAKKDMKPTKHMAVQTFHLMSKIMKILKEADKLIAFMNRGLGYTDVHHMDYKSQEKSFNLVKKPICN